MTLGELHEEIQRLTGFDNDHLFTFFVARGHRGGRTEVVESDDWEDRHDGLYGIPLKEMFPLTLLDRDVCPGLFSLRRLDDAGSGGNR